MLKNRWITLQNFVRLLAVIILLSTSIQLAQAQDSGGFNIFLPYAANGGTTYSISGQITTEDQIPISGVVITTEDGQSALTDENGEYKLEELAETVYTLTPSKLGYVFYPASSSVVVPPDVTHVNFTTDLTSCSDGLVNGGFESSTGWYIPATAYSAGYSITRSHSGDRSLRTGIVALADNSYSYSSGRQLVAIPSAASSAILTFWIFPMSTETSNAPLPAVPQGEWSSAPLENDIQYVIILNTNNQVIETLVWQKSNSQSWTKFQFDLLKYKGRSIKIEFGTYNDGYGGITAMYVDDAALELCPSTATPTATLPPGQCANIMVNDSFETNAAWEIPLTAYPADYTTAQAHTGNRSMRTGITTSSHNRYSYSDARQTISIPAGSGAVTLEVWVYASSGETASAKLPAIPEGDQFGLAPLAGDVQYILVLDQNSLWIDTLLWQRRNNQVWTQHQFNLTKYSGRTIKIQFGTYNDGYSGITSMHLDDMKLYTCTSTPTPTKTTQPGDTPTPTPTPTKTATPSACYNAITNGGLETTSAWEIPLTVYPADYSTSQAHSGLRSMRTGIVNLAHNRYSYSDSRQTVNIPANATSATLSFWIYASSGEVASLPLPEIPSWDTFGQAPLASDLQYLLILDQNQNWIDTLIWQRSNSQVWKYFEFSLKKFAGKTIKIQFGTYNDGYSGITSMYFDDVILNICQP